MIELPRAALQGAARSPSMPQFFSFGTNDLTQMTLGSQPRRRRQLPRDLSRARRSSPPIRSARSTRTGSASSCRLAAERRPRDAGPTSSSASAASMAVIRPRSSSAIGRVSTTSPARPTGCRSPASRRPGGARARRERLLSTLATLRRGGKAAPGARPWPASRARPARARQTAAAGRGLRRRPRGRVIGLTGPARGRQVDAALRLIRPLSRAGCDRRRARCRPVLAAHGRRAAR